MYVVNRIPLPHSNRHKQLFCNLLKLRDCDIKKSARSIETQKGMEKKNKNMKFSSSLTTVA